MFSRHQRQRIFTKPQHERPFQRGDFKYIILHHLKDKPSYGYEIIQELGERFHGAYIPSPGIIYPTLQMLEEMEYVTVAAQDGKKIYTITDLGLQFLVEHGEYEEKLENRMKTWWTPENINEISEIRHDFERLTQLLNSKVRTVDAEKLGRIHKIISSAYADISKD